VCDFDGDGRRDLLVGDGASGQVYFYRNTNTDAQPILMPGVTLKVGAAALSVPVARATPCVFDWDGDGLPDLLCGSYYGDVYFFRNTNTASAPIYAPAVAIQAGGVALNLGIRSVVRVFDWDGDGLNDLVCSSDTGVYWCRNTNNNSNPILQAKVALQVPVAGGSFANVYTGGRMRVFLAGWNNDGAMGLLVGNLAGTITYFEGYRFAFGSSPRSENGPFALRWNSAPYLRYNVFAGSDCTALTNQLITNYVSGGSITCWSNRPVTSPQFYRVQVAP
jgi:hypothetical protein